jgi:hypothetical protein
MDLAQTLITVDLKMLFPEWENQDGGFARTLGDIVLGPNVKASDAAGFGNLKASQEQLTGQDLMNKWNAQYRQNYTGGQQKTPEQEGMPSMPGTRLVQNQSECVRHECW